MEIRRVSDSLLRSRPSPLLSFLAPSISSSRQQSVQTPSYVALARLSISRRPLITHSSLQWASAASTAAQAQETDDQGGLSQPPSRTSPKNEGSIQNSISNLLDQTLVNESGRSRISRPFTRPLENTRHPSSGPVRDSARKATESRQGFQENRQGRILEGMNFSKSSDLSRAIAADIAVPLKPRAVRTIHSRPSVGRTIELDPGRGVDLARGLQRLQAQLNVNKVRSDQQRQRFHERPGLKRKRLKGERWRKRFKQGFIAIVEKVQQMRKQGW